MTSSATGAAELEKYPFHLMTQRYGFSTRIKGNWKLAVDSVCEWYHPPYVHGRFIDPDVAKAEQMVPPVDSYHYDLFPPHMLTSVPGPPQLPPREPGNARPGAPGAEVGLPGCSVPGSSDPTTCRTSAELPEFLNRGDIGSWGNDQFWVFPNISMQIWARNFYITYTYWPETVDSHIYEIDLYFVPPANAPERLAQELVVDSTIEFAMQDVNTIEATHSALKTRAQDTFFLSDQELLIRQFHTVIRETVAAHQAGEKRSHDGDHLTAAAVLGARAVTSPTGPGHPQGAVRGAAFEPFESWRSSTTRWPCAPRRPSPTWTP